MIKKKSKVIVSMLLVFAFLLTACGKTAKAGEDGILYTALNSEPGSLDPGLAQSTPEGWVLSHLYTGLLTYDENGDLVEGMSEMPTVSEDGLKYTFKIKDGMKWSNGDPVTAKDFEYEWVRVLNPETASIYAFQLYHLKGAEDLNTVEKPGIVYVKDDDGNDTEEIDHEVTYDEKDLEGLDINGKTDEEIKNLVFEKWIAEKKANVGVKAVDEKTLEVELENPTPYFPELTAFYTLYPVNSKIAEENPDWAKKGGETYVSNGAFTLKEWKHNDKVELLKNENWFNADKVTLEGITFDVLEDLNTAWQNYDAGKYGLVVDPPQEIVAQKFEEKDEELKIGKQIGTYYYNLNNLETASGDNPFVNKNIRKAFSMALDRETLVNKVTKGGQIAATGMVPFGLKDENGNDFREENGTLVEYNLEKAKELLVIGLEEEGLKIEDLNGKVLLYNTDESHKKVAQAAQQMWKTALGVEIQLENVDFNVKIAREHAHDFEISRGGWVGDFADPMTMLEIFVTGGAMNDSGFSNETYDEYIKAARSSGDQTVRMNAMKEAEKVLMEEMPLVPVYFYTQPYFVKSNVKGIYKPLLEFPCMTYAEYEEVESK